MATRDIKKILRDLKKLMRDQADKPEGVLASEIYEKLKEKYPDVNEVEDKVVKWRYHFGDMPETGLWCYSAEAHNIQVYGLKRRSRRHLLSEGSEIDMIIAKAEWEHAVKQYRKMETQLMRAIVNEIWPQICKPNTGEHDEEEESMVLAFIQYIKPYQKVIPELQEPREEGSER